MEKLFSFKQLRLLTWLTYIIFNPSRIPLAECSGSANNAAGSGGGVYGGRHSYSLSTFSPSGDLDQVARAMRASVSGAPIAALSLPPSMPGVTTSATAGGIESVPEVGVATRGSSPLPSRGGIYLSVPMRSLATSPFLIDDGTPRVVQITSSICAAHTGVGADGRALCDIAIKLALDYRYVYGEEISVEELLEGLAERVQEMTMKAGSRPFGCALMVGHLASDDSPESEGPTMYRVDPSGAVVLLNSFSHREGFDSRLQKDVDQETIIEDIGLTGSVAFLGNWEPLGKRRESLRSQLENQQFTSEEELRSAMTDVARQTYMDESHISNEIPPASVLKKRLNQPILFASFTHDQGLQISRITNSK